MMYGIYLYTEIFGVAYDWSNMPRWYVLAGQVCISISFQGLYSYLKMNNLN